MYEGGGSFLDFCFIIISPKCVFVFTMVSPNLVAQ